ncbi:MAG: hypothetical protein HS116_22520 [Planctomycetes bacterium]|nr:hypothetical protein [Planctomycetota bacterium]
MTMNEPKQLAVCLIAVLLAGRCTATETELHLRASEVLPPGLLQSSVHTVNEEVGLDRFLFVFEMESPFGVYRVTSVDMLRIRVHELQVLSRAKDISGMEEFAGSLKDSVVQVPIAVVDTVTSPVASVRKAGEGVKGKFASVGRFFSGRSKSEYEDSAVKEAVVGARKREVAAELGLDAYSTNPKVQQLLNHLARARALGAGPVRLAGMAAPPAVGWTLAMLRLRESVEDDLAQKPPGELHALNNDKLKKLGIHESAREAFLNNPSYSPRHKTVICANLDAMRDVDGKENFLLTTVMDDSEDDAFFAERQSDMILYYHKKVSRFERIERTERVPICLTKEGVMVVLAPLDLVVLYERSQGVLDALTEIARDIQARKVRIVVSGQATDACRKKLAESGIDLITNFPSSAEAEARER